MTDQESVLLDNYTLTSPLATFTLTPSYQYTHLYLLLLTRSDDAATVDYAQIWLNGDSDAANYDYMRFGATSGIDTWNRGQNAIPFGEIAADNCLAGGAGILRVDFYFYTATWRKRFLIHSVCSYGAASELYEQYNNAMWQETDPIGQITINCLNGNFKIGTRLHLFGVK